MRKRNEIIPIVKCSDIVRSTEFYLGILNFMFEEDTSEHSHQSIFRQDERIDLSSHSGDGVFGSCVYIIVEDVDAVYRETVECGLDVSGLTGVHAAPVDQTWGMREFYVDDPDGNTLRFAQEIKRESF